MINNFALEHEYWQSKWFHLPQEKWPVEEYDFEPSHLHLASYNPKFLVAFTKVVPTIPTFLDRLMEKFQSWRKVRLILAYILFWKNDWRNAMEDAETYLLSISQPSQEQLKSVEKKFRIEKRKYNPHMFKPNDCKRRRAKIDWPSSYTGKIVKHWNKV